MTAFWFTTSSHRDGRHTRYRATYDITNSPLAAPKYRRPCTSLRPSSPSGPGVACSDQEPLRHMREIAYRCFLPDLAGFTSSHCAGPGPQHRSRRPDPKEKRPRTGINPAIADCGLQGTATSPSSTAKPIVAEGVGFEPTRRLPVYTLSRRAPSAARTPLRAFKCKLRFSIFQCGGGGGIRTHEALLTPTRFRGEHDQPLRHPSGFSLRTAFRPGALEKTPPRGKRILLPLHRSLLRPGGLVFHRGPGPRAIRKHPSSGLSPL